MIKKLFNKEVSIQSWMDIFTNSAFSNPFQSPEFYEAYNSIANHSADVFAIEDEGKITSLVIVTLQKEKGLLGFFSRRGIIYGGPLISNTNHESLVVLLQWVTSYYKTKLIYIEIRNSFSYNNLKQSFLDSKWILEPHLNVQLFLDSKSVDDILNLMTYNRRREIKMSLKENTLVNISDSLDEIDKFYTILSDLYRTRVKVPLPQKDYFLSLKNSSIAKIFIVKHNNNVIGGAFCITDSINSINTLYYAGLRDYHKKIFPTHIAIMGVIEYAVKHNLKTIDFMGAGKPEIKYGVRDYKIQFGGSLVEYGRFIHIFNPFLFRLGIFGLKIIGLASKIKNKI